MTKRNLVLALLATVWVSGCVMMDNSFTPEKQVVKRKEIVFPAPPEQARFYYERTLYSSADIKPDTATDLFKRAVTGESKTGQALVKPYGVTVHKGRVFVGDTVRRIVMAFDYAENRYISIGDGDKGTLAMPLGIDTDDAGNLYVADGTLKKVVVFNRDGKFLRYLAEPEGGKPMLNKPAGVGVDAKGERVYVVDIGGIDTDEHRVRAFDAKTGQHLFTIGHRGTGNGEFNLPRDVVVAPDGTLYVVDGGNFRVQQFAADGKFLRVFGGVGRQSGQFSRPKEISVDRAGNLYVVDAAFGNFQIFTPEGKPLLDVGGRSNADGPAKFLLPSGIAVDEDGRVYMVDQFFKKVDIFRPATVARGGGFLGPLEQ